MAIGRPQIPSQIDAFAPGGDVTVNAGSPTFTQAHADELARLLMIQREAKQMDYPSNVEKYKTRLGEFAEPTARMNIYDFASELGAGLLSTPNTGGASAFTGLGVGFNRASERMRNAEAEDRKMRQQVGMQAAQMAMQDEKGALDYLRQIELKNIDYKNKRGDLLTFEYTDKDGVVHKQTVRDNYANDDIIDDLIQNKGAIEVKTPSSEVNLITGQVSKRDEKAIDAQYKMEEEIFAKRKAGISSIANVDEALAIATRLGVDNFGAVESLTMYPRKLIDALGKKDSEVIGDQILLNQISMGFTMDIVSRTKGAISNREMELFIQASPGLGSNYNGFIKQANYLKRIAQRDVDYARAYADKANELEEQELDGELTASQVKRQLDLFEGDWYDDNLIFDKTEMAELENIVKNRVGYAEGFDENKYQKKYREGQDKIIESSYSTNQSPQLRNALTLREQVESGTGKYAGLTEEERIQKLNEIDNLIQEISGQ